MWWFNLSTPTVSYLITYVAIVIMIVGIIFMAGYLIGGTVGVAV